LPSFRTPVGGRGLMERRLPATPWIRHLGEVASNGKT
jgi:hypothetical protein